MPDSFEFPFGHPNPAWIVSDLPVKAEGSCIFDGERMPLRVWKHGRAIHVAVELHGHKCSLRGAMPTSGLTVTPAGVFVRVRLDYDGSSLALFLNGEEADRVGISA